MDSLRQLEAGWIASLQALGGDPWLTWLMKGFSVLGLEFFYGVAVILLLGWDRRIGTRFCCLFFAAAAVSELLKLAGHGPRPYWINPQVVNFTAPNFSFGMPSGHTFYATCGWLFLAGLAPAHWKWAKPVAWLMIGLVGFSRIWLGVHFISDVAGGLVTGWLYLKLFEVVERLYGNTLTRLDLRQQLMLAAAAAGFTHSLGLALRTGGLAAARAADWAPVYLDRVRWDAVGPAGLLFGFITGLALAQRWARYEVPNSWWQRGFCILVGGAGLAAFHYGLKVPKSLAGTVWDQWAVFFRYTLMMVWMIFVTPLICLRLGWAASGRVTPSPVR